MGGETPLLCAVRRHVDGLSPRGRGNRPVAPDPRRRRRSIPAWAGKPMMLTSRVNPSTVYPRVGGETFKRRSLEAAEAGLSPRGRGNQQPRCCGPIQGGSIPAWAGKPGAGGCSGNRTAVYPRVGGETKLDLIDDMTRPGLSPRGRGNHECIRGVEPRSGSIPAWAGKPRRPRASGPHSEVYPRVGGETMTAPSEKSSLGGLSPRGRGNPWPGSSVSGDGGSIPAWAGKP